MKPVPAMLVAAWVIGSPWAPAMAAEGLAGAEVRPAPYASERAAREGPASRPADRRAQREQWCADNPDKCREVKARMAERRAQCEADPERCRQAAQARRAERGMPGLARHFDAVDANRDGEITPDEINAARRARAANRKRQPG